uniref:Uncharacterized protein n=1 Tax=Pseudomonas monteilii TaxID=76759 RepID=A0A6B7PZW5_9PSED|nr:hypothetical protein [Pseudomonas monteilii]
MPIDFRLPFHGEKTTGCRSGVVPADPKDARYNFDDHKIHCYAERRVIRFSQ